MSALGPKQTWASAVHMSAFGGKADMRQERDWEPHMKFFLPVQETKIAEESYQAIKKFIEKQTGYIGQALLRDLLPRE
jgi:hypothetical protein